MAVNAVKYGNQTVMDISDSTVTPQALAEGFTAYSASGAKIEGVLQQPYVHIRYAAQQPSASAPTIGTTPNAWMGIYSGTAATAPTAWSAYTWYNIKGATGAKGATGPQGPQGATGATGPQGPQGAADTSALSKSGGTMTGTLTAKGIVLTQGVDYGDSLPSTVTPGKLFFKKVS